MVPLVLRGEHRALRVRMLDFRMLRRAQVRKWNLSPFQLGWIAPTSTIRGDVAA
jgi:hypothetical protein